MIRRDEMLPVILEACPSYEPAWQAFLAEMGNPGDWGRQHVADLAMLDRLAGRRFESALDVGCGEGRFHRMPKENDIPTAGASHAGQVR